MITNDIVQKAKRLINIIIYQDQLKQKEHELRQELVNKLDMNNIIKINDWLIEKINKKITIVDPDKLKMIKINPRRVTVNIQKIDPNLVRIIGEKENKKYFDEQPTIIVKKVS